MKPTRTLLLTLAALALLAPSSSSARASSAPSRDWDACPALVEVDTQRDIYVIGDVHGDYKRLVKLLVAGELIEGEPTWPKDVVWSGRKSVLVFTGDLIDKWYHGIDVIELLRGLKKSAAKQGGQVIVSTGNHEVEFLADPEIKKARDFREELADQNISPEDVAAGKDRLGLGKYLLCLPFASRVNGWFFSHAGDTGGRTLKKLRKDLENGVETDGYDTEILTGDDGLVEARMRPPWWEKKKDDPEESVARLRKYAEALGVRHIVFGHQPGTYEFNDGSERERGTMFQNFNGLVFLIDVGMSRGVDDSKGAILHIQRDGDSDMATAIFHDGSQERLWREKRVAVVFPGRNETPKRSPFAAWTLPIGRGGQPPQHAASQQAAGR